MNSHPLQNNLHHGPNLGDIDGLRFNRARLVCQRQEFHRLAGGLMASALFNNQSTLTLCSPTCSPSRNTGQAESQASLTATKGRFPDDANPKHRQWDDTIPCRWTVLPPWTPSRSIT
jgi:hypothetical protein